MNMNLHNVTALDLTTPYQLSTGAWVRDLIVNMPNGQTLTVTMFADNRDNLLVKG